MYSKEQAKLLRKEFWIVFARRCEIVPELRHKKKKWILYDTGLSGIDLKFEVSRTEALVMIEINSRLESRRLEIFETLQKYRKFLEEGFAGPLEWDICFVRGKRAGSLPHLHFASPCRFSPPKPMARHFQLHDRQYAFARKQPDGNQGCARRRALLGITSANEGHAELVSAY